MIKSYMCQGCGKVFEAQSWRKRKYCSKKCKGLHDKSGQFKKGHKGDYESEQYRISKIKENPSHGMLGKNYKG